MNIPVTVNLRPCQAIISYKAIIPPLYVFAHAQVSFTIMEGPRVQNPTDTSFQQQVWKSLKGRHFLNRYERISYRNQPRMLLESFPKLFREHFVRLALLKAVLQTLQVKTSKFSLFLLHKHPLY